MQISNILKLRVRKTIGGQQKQTSEGKLNSVKIQAFNKRLVNILWISTKFAFGSYGWNIFHNLHQSLASLCLTYEW